MVGDKHMDLNLLTMEEVAEKLKVAPRTVYGWVCKGMPVMKIGGVLRFDPEEVMAWMKQKRTRGRNKSAHVGGDTERSGL